MDKKLPCFVTSILFILELPSTGGHSRTMDALDPGSSAAFAYAHERYAALRHAAYAATLRGVAGVSPATKLTPLSPHAIRAFQRQWQSPHWSGAGNWAWTLLARRFARKPRSFHAALWHESMLCGLCVGRVSKGREHLTLHYLESSPIPTHPLRGLVMPIMFEAALQYALALGVKELRLREPLSALIPRYKEFGFRVVGNTRNPIYLGRILANEGGP